MEECLSQNIICKLCTKMSQILTNMTNRWHSIASVAKFIRKKFGWRSMCKNNMQNNCNIFDVIFSCLSGFFVINLVLVFQWCLLDLSTIVTFSSTNFALIRMIPAPCNYSLCFLNVPITSTFLTIFTMITIFSAVCNFLMFFHY